MVLFCHAIDLLMENGTILVQVYVLRFLQLLSKGFGVLLLLDQSLFQQLI